ncbi:Serpentine Receptor, class M [Caenorhabditis elegans]|nr:Serpentine Receptor, class M [Caenorhabditis elegans]CCD69190.2 Serpentine Receptor, class M [Caenorhabditis elegans]
MFISIGFLIIIFPVYGIVSVKIYKSGFPISLQKWINIIAAISLLIFCFIFISVILIGSDLQMMNQLLTPTSFRLGYSAWLSVSSAVLLIPVMIPSFYFSYKKIRHFQKFNNDL